MMRTQAFEPNPRSVTFQVARRICAAAKLWHRARVEGLHHLPDGPALLVGNHGLYGLDTPVFFYLVWQATGRAPVGLADRVLVKLPPMRAMLSELGGFEGTREKALELLRAGNLVMVYPGGAREVFKDPARRHQLAWDQALGFLRVARDAQVPVVPVAGVGVDDTFRVLTRVDALARLMHHDKYRVPVGVGVGPLPLPSRFRFSIEAPLAPPPPEADDARLLEYKHELEGVLQDALTSLERRLRHDA